MAAPLVDSHVELPRVAAPAATSWRSIAPPSRALADAGAWAMTAHILYARWTPRCPATLSRNGDRAGDPPRHRLRRCAGQRRPLHEGAARGARRAWRATAIAAGCDLVLHCNGVLAETAAPAGRLPGAVRCRGVGCRRRGAGRSGAPRRSIRRPDAARDTACLARRRRERRDLAAGARRRRSRRRSWPSPCTRRRMAMPRWRWATTRRSGWAGSASTRCGMWTRSARCWCRAFCWSASC